MTIDDHEKALLQFAAGIVSKVLARGKDTHEPGEWFRQGMTTHLTHAITHLDSAEEVTLYPDRRDAGEWLEDAENALCRLTFLLYLKSLEPDARSE